jgi:hypothetical protein
MVYFRRLKTNQICEYEFTKTRRKNQGGLRKGVKIWELLAKRIRYSIIHGEIILQSLIFQEYPEKQLRYFSFS